MFFKYFLKKFDVLILKIKKKYMKKHHFYVFSIIKVI
jgi:hypothetical protein